MRKLLAMGAGLALAISAGCGGDNDGGNDKEQQGGSTTMPSSVYFGAVATTTDRLAVALEDGGSKVKAFLTDGEPRGDAEWFEGSADKGKFSLKSASGRASIEGTVQPAETTGTVR